jgi:hypothetical protein
MPCPKDSSRTDSTGRAYKGSQRQIQTYVNDKTNALNSAIAQALPQFDLNEKAIHWASPLKDDMYSEYRDSEFLERVGLAHASALRKFWPRNGPCWDALADSVGAPDLSLVSVPSTTQTILRQLLINTTHRALTPFTNEAHIVIRLKITPARNSPAFFQTGGVPFSIGIGFCFPQSQLAS